MDGKWIDGQIVGWMNISSIMQQLCVPANRRGQKKKGWMNIG